MPFGTLSPSAPYDPSQYDSGDGYARPVGRRLGYGPPRVTAPRITTTSGPGGDTTRVTQPYNDGADPAQEIGNATVNMGFAKPVQVPIDTAMRYQNEGLIPRGPSGPGHPNAPISYSSGNPGTAPGMSQPNGAGGTNTLSTAPGTDAGAGQAVTKMPSRAEQVHLQSMHQEARTRHSLGDEDGAKKVLDDAAKYRQKIFGEDGTGQQQAGTGNSQVPFYIQSPGGQTGQQPAQQSATTPNTPYINPDTGAPQKLAPITQPAPSYISKGTDGRLAVDKNSPGYQQSIRTMYNTAGDSLKADPHLGETPVTSRSVPNGALAYAQSGNNPDAPVPLLTPSQAAQAVQAGPAQTQRNMAATQRMQDASTSKQIDTNAGQNQQNQNAASAIALRLQQFKQPGNYDISQPISLDDIHETTAQRQAHEAMPNGAPFTFQGKQYVKGQQGPVQPASRTAGQGGQSRLLKPNEFSGM